jgi:uncharacterized protein YndB with AHSA1/START domain
MAEHSVEHASFTIERHYDAPPAKVFAAWSSREAKARWFRAPEDWVSGPRKLDFRIGGREVDVGGPPGGPVHTYNAVYWDIVPDERIVYTYELLLDETRLSVSLVTVAFVADAEGTVLRLTEYGAFFDGLEDPGLREQGTGSLLEALGRELA